MRQIPLLVAIFVCFSCKHGMNEKLTSYIDVTEDIVVPKHYIVSKNEGDIVIDGISNESSWKMAKFSDSFIDIEGIDTPKYDTKIKMLWDEEYLYVYSEMEEPHIWADIKNRDEVIFYNNDFEVFIDPSGTTKNYAEIEINALGTVWDLLLDKPYRSSGKPNNHWNLNKLKSAVHINGTINDSSDIDSMWSVEMAIPMKALMELGLKPYPKIDNGDQWRINFSRVEWNYDIVDSKYQRKKVNDKFLKEYNWVWSNQKVINMHEPEKWGVLQFTNEVSSLGVVYKENEEMEIQQVAYALFRQTKFGSLKEFMNLKVGKIKNVSVKFSEKEPIIATFYKTNFGFEFKIRIKESDKIFIINEEGVLKKV
ncbi:hypothetical protein GGR42_000927 [Saonia flava]|uniref:Carbohydrate-binding domain-containing protein n=1 Tax=Saonia flava TaxID=523696 RepID=A0A846QXV1_9FLAO|nr:carbohydrate-binding family 9-like protein [Saonia flava]NJB70465.1 hypothetical protein [Saonia flava]